MHEIERFYANFDSIRYVGDNLVIRLRHAPTDAPAGRAQRTVRPPRVSGQIRRVEPFSIERRQDDRLEFDRIAFKFAKHGYGDLRALIDVLNGYALTEG